MEIIWTCIAAAGGIAHYLYDYDKNNTQFRIAQIFAKAFISGFSGWTHRLTSPCWS